jgi:hypothetical protein
MANNRTITAANAVITLAIPGLFPAPQQLKGFSADNVYETSAQDVVETAMGVDGRLSGGFVYSPVEQTFALQADSESNFLFEQWAAFMSQQKDAFFANGRTTLPAIQRAYVSSRGFLINLPPLPSAARTLQARRYTIRWESVVSVPKT